MMCKKTVILHVLLVCEEIGLIDRVYIFTILSVICITIYTENV